MKFIFITFLILCLVAIAFAQTNTTTPPAPLNAGVAITAPLLNATVALGSNYTIRWSILDPNATTIEAISLMNGSAAALTLVTSNILTNGSIPVSSLAYNWTVPTNLTLAAGNDYVIAMLGNNSAYTYSPYFTLQ